MSNKVKLIIAAVIGLVVVILVTSFVLKPKANVNANEHYDANSGETVSDPVGKGADKYGTNGDEPIYLGISILIDHGVTYDQIGDLKKAFYAFSKKSPVRIKEVSIKVSSIRNAPHNAESESTVDTIYFDVVMDRKTTYQAKFEYSNLNTAQLYLYQDGSKSIFFDSGKISPVLVD